MTQASDTGGGRAFRKGVQADLSRIDWTRRGDTFLRLIGETAQELGPYEATTSGGQLYSTEERLEPHGHVTATSPGLVHTLELQKFNGKMRATVSSAADDINVKLWRKILASAVKKQDCTQPRRFSCWVMEDARELAMPGRALVSPNGAPLFCEASFEPFLYRQPTLAPQRGGGQPHVAYPTRITGTSEGADFQEARERFVEQVSALCHAATVQTGSSWSIVVDPVEGEGCPREWVIDDRNVLLTGDERALLPPASDPLPAEPLIYLSQCLSDDDELRGLCGSFHHAVQLAPLAPSTGGLLFVAIIEALGNRNRNRNRHASQELDDEDGEELGAVKAFEEGLAYAGAVGHDFDNLKRAYQERSLTAHAAIMHGDELYGVEFPRMRTLEKVSAIRFSRGIVPRLQYTCNLGLRRALHEVLLTSFPTDDLSAWTAAYSLL